MKSKYRILKVPDAITPWVLERSDGRGNWTVLAYFTTEAEAKEALQRYINNGGYRK